MSALDDLVEIHDSECTLKRAGVDCRMSEKARAELAALRATVAALTSERDAAYRRGWDAAIEAAASVPVDFANYAENRDLSGGYSCREVEKLIRDLQTTDHDADMLEACADVVIKDSDMLTEC